MHPKPPPPKHPIPPGHGPAQAKDPLLTPAAPVQPSPDRSGKRNALASRMGVNTRPPVRRSGRQGK